MVLRRRFYRLCVTLFLSAATLSSVEAQTQPLPPVQPLNQQFDDWVWRCVTTDRAVEAAADGEQSEGDGTQEPQILGCEIRQSLSKQENGQALTLLKLAVSKANDKAGKVSWALVVVTPLNVALPADLGVAIGGEKPETVRYRNCTHDGCYAIYPLDDNRIQSMKRALDGAVYFRVLNGQAIKVPFSLKGFTKAFTALESGNLPEQNEEPQAQSDQ